LIQHGFNRKLILDGYSGNFGILDILIEDMRLEASVKASRVRAWDPTSLPTSAETPANVGL
jgi:hypothetical protein